MKFFIELTIHQLPYKSFYIPCEISKIHFFIFYIPFYAYYITLQGNYI